MSGDSSHVSSGHNTSLNVNASSGSEHSGSRPSDEHVVEYTIQDVENMFEDIIRVILENEINTFIIPTSFNQGLLMDEVKADIANIELTKSETSSLSSGMLGFSSGSDTCSDTSSETEISIATLKEDLRELLSSIKVMNEYLESYTPGEINGAI